MRTFHGCVCAGTLVAALLLSGPALAQWFDDEEAPAGVGEILNPFTFKGFGLGSGAEVSGWAAPGDNITAMTFVVRGGYTFESVPVYLGLEAPLTWAKVDVLDTSTDEFALGQIGINLKARVDPDLRFTSIFTGWSLDVYVPTFMGDVQPPSYSSLAHGAGLSNTLLPGIHANPESVNVVGTFDLIVPGHWIFFQFELSAAAYFPVTHTDERKIQGALLWGGILGVYIAQPISFLVEFKGYTPLGVEDENGSTAPTLFAISPGLRLKFGPFKPAVWVSFPLNDRYRDAWPDIIVGLDLAIWM